MPDAQSAATELVLSPIRSLGGEFRKQNWDNAVANYARGFKRVYAVAAVLWIAILLIAAANARPDTLIESSPVSEYVAIAVLVPALGYPALFVLFPWVVLWTARGFSPTGAVVCTECGKRQPPSFEFCPACGTPLGSDGGASPR